MYYIYISFRMLSSEINKNYFKGQFLVTHSINADRSKIVNKSRNF